MPPKPGEGDVGERAVSEGLGEGADEGVVGDDEMSEVEAGPLSRNFRKCTCGGEW